MLDNLLKDQGYQPIPLRLTPFGHLELHASINGIESLFLLDTGAASTVVDMAYAHEHGLEVKTTEIKGGGVGTSELDIYQLDLEELNFFDFGLKDITIYAADLSHVRQSLENKGETVLPCGVIGADILVAHKAIIDYGSLCLFLKSKFDI